MIKSDHEQFAQGAFSLTKNEQLAQKCFNIIVFLSTFFYKFFVIFFKNKRFTHSLFFKERCERASRSGCSWQKSNCEWIAQQKWATVIYLLRSLTKNEQPWDIRSGCSPKLSKGANCPFFDGIAHLLIFRKKNSDSLKKPIKEFPSLLKSYLTFG